MKHLCLSRLSIAVALVTLGSGCTPHVWVPVPPVPANPARDFDLQKTALDANGMAINPPWGSQTGGRPASCKSGKAWDPACTSEKVVSDKGNPACVLYSALTGNYPGHKDWSEAQYTGAIGWLNYAEDGDINLMLVPQDGVGVTDQNHLAKGVQVGSAGSGTTPYIELEFASSEVISGSQTSSWVKLRDAANTYIHNGRVPILNDNPQEHDVLPCGVVYGIIGLDAEHGGASEVHPVHALAIQVDDRPDTNTWAIFARNWGDEGFCSHYDHQLTTSGGSFWVLLPRATNTGPVQTDFELPQKATKPPFQFWPGKGLAIQFQLPTAGSHGLAEAVVHIRWPDNTGVFSCPAARYTDIELLKTIEDTQHPDSVEQYLRSLIKTKAPAIQPQALGPAQLGQAAVEIRESPAPQPVKPSGRLSKAPAEEKDLLGQVCASFTPGQEPTDKIDLRSLCAKRKKK